MPKGAAIDDYYCRDNGQMCCESKVLLSSKPDRLSRQTTETNDRRIMQR
jgi:hypothetical protein